MTKLDRFAGSGLDIVARLKQDFVFSVKLEAHALNQFDMLVLGCVSLTFSLRVCLGSWIRVSLVSSLRVSLGAFIL